MKHKGPPPPSHPYNRPNRPFVCGRQCEGSPCQFGPLPNGKCPDKNNPCQPKWSLRKRRTFITTLTCLLSLAMVSLCLWLSNDHPILLSPGPLSIHHAKLLRPSEPGAPEQCSKCHAVTDNNHWFSANLIEHDHYVDSKTCIECHQNDRLSSNQNISAWLKPHGLEDTKVYPEMIAQKFNKETHCIQCHREHRGLHASITVMSEEQCQNCHQKQFNSFNDGHPEFKIFPYKNPIAIEFNHSRKEHQDMQCTTCHTYNRKDEKQMLSNFQQSCAQCHQKDLTDVDRFKFTVFQLAPTREKNIDVSPLMEYLFSSPSEGSSALAQYLKVKKSIYEMLNQVLPPSESIDTPFLQILFKGCDPQKVIATLGISDSEMASIWASESHQNSEDFFLQNFWATLLKNNRSNSIHEDVLNLFLLQKEPQLKRIYALYLSYLYRSPELFSQLNALMSQNSIKTSDSILSWMKKQDNLLLKNLTQWLYSTPSISLTEQETSLFNEFQEIIDSEFNDKTWISWSIDKFLQILLIEEEFIDMDAILLALEDDDLEKKLSDLKLDEQLAQLLVLRKNSLSPIFQKLKTPFLKTDAPAVLSEQDQSLLEEFQDIVDAKYDPFKWSQNDLTPFLTNVLIEEEHIDIDTILLNLDDKKLETALKDVDSDKIVSTLLKFQKQRLENIFSSLVKLNTKNTEKADSIPAELTDYATDYQKDLKNRKQKQSLPYFFDEPSPQWSYHPETQSIFYASGLHADPVHLALLEGHPKNHKLGSILISQLGDCSSCHTHPSIKNVNEANVWRSPIRKTLHNFKHFPHIQNMSMECAHCHKKEGSGGISGSGFYPIKKAQCTNCHNADVAGEDCLQCHNYHADQLHLDVNDAKSMLIKLGLD